MTFSKCCVQKKNYFLKWVIILMKDHSFLAVFSARHAWIWQSPVSSYFTIGESFNWKICEKRLPSIFRPVKKPLLGSRHVTCNNLLSVIKFCIIILIICVMLGGACHSWTEHICRLWDSRAVLRISYCTYPYSWSSKVKICAFKKNALLYNLVSRDLRLS